MIYNPYENQGTLIPEDTRTEEEKKKSRELAASIDLENSPTAITSTQGATPVLMDESGYVPESSRNTLTPEAGDYSRIIDAINKLSEGGGKAALPTMGEGLTVSGPTKSTFANTQTDLMNMLMDRATGKSESVAAQAIKMQNDRNLRQQMALAATQSANRNTGAVGRQLLQSAALGGQEANQLAAQLMLKERQDALNAAVGASTGFRGQDQSFEQLVQKALVANQASKDLRDTTRFTGETNINIANLDDATKRLLGALQGESEIVSSGDRRYAADRGLESATYSPDKDMWDKLSVLASFVPKG